MDAERRTKSEPRRMDDLQAQLDAARQEVRDTKLAAKLAEIHQTAKEAAVQAETASTDADVANGLATKSIGMIDTHERECVIRYAGIRDELKTLGGLPGAVVEMASRLTESRNTRENQHADTLKRLQGQDDALKAIEAKMDKAMGGASSRVIQGLATFIAALLGLIGWLLARYAMPP